MFSRRHAEDMSCCILCMPLYWLTFWYLTNKLPMEEECMVKVAL